MQPRISPDWINKRRTLFKTEDWTAYTSLMRE
jgi:hypothetical protein